MTYSGITTIIDRPLVRGALLLLTVLTVMLLRRIYKQKKSKIRHIRGPKLLSYKEALRKAERSLKAGDAAITWAGVKIPEQSAGNHFAIIGATGSGKTVTISAFMQSVLPSIIEGSGKRALIYDNKQDMLPVLSEMNINCPVYTLNPFDRRGIAWDIASDIRSPSAAYQAASTLIPRNPHASQPFFDNAARHILSGVIIALVLTRGRRWNLKDVLLILRNKETIVRMLSISTETASVLEYFSNLHTAQNVLSSLRSHMQPYEIIAAAWSHAEVSLSLESWANKSSVLLLGNDERARDALDAINRLIFKRISEILLSRDEGLKERTWIILDEVREAGKLNGLNSLLTRGRSKGVSIMLGFQDIEGLRDVYGPRMANEMVGQCGHIGVLGLCSPETAEWASRRFGESESVEKQTAENRQYGASSGFLKKSGETVSDRIRREKLVLPSEFLHLPSPPVAGKIHGFFISPGIGAFRGEIDLPDLKRINQKSEVGIIYRPPEQEYMEMESTVAAVPLLSAIKR